MLLIDAFIHFQSGKTTMAPRIVKYFNLKLSVWILSCEVTYPPPKALFQMIFVFRRDMLVPWMVRVWGLQVATGHGDYAHFPSRPTQAKAFEGHRRWADMTTRPRTTKINQNQKQEEEEQHKGYLEKKQQYSKQHWNPKSQPKDHEIKKVWTLYIFFSYYTCKFPQKLRQVGHWLSELLTPSCKHVIRPSPNGLTETQDIQMGVS